MQTMFTSFNEEVIVPYRETSIKLRIRPAGNDDYLEKLRKISKPHRKAFSDDEISYTKMRELEDKALAGTVLIGWEGASDEYEERLAEEQLFLDPYLRKFVRETSQNEALFLLEDVDALEKKS